MQVRKDHDLLWSIECLVSGNEHKPVVPERVDWSARPHNGVLVQIKDLVVEVKQVLILELEILL